MKCEGWQDYNFRDGQKEAANKSEVLRPSALLVPQKLPTSASDWRGWGLTSIHSAVDQFAKIQKHQELTTGQEVLSVSNIN